MNIISGVGFQEGLNLGSRIYLRKLGLKGIICGLPFDLKGTNDIDVKNSSMK